MCICLYLCLISKNVKGEYQEFGVPGFTLAFNLTGCLVMSVLQYKVFITKAQKRMAGHYWHHSKSERKEVKSYRNNFRPKFQFFKVM